MEDCVFLKNLRVAFERESAIMYLLTDMKEHREHHLSFFCNPSKFPFFFSHSSNFISEKFKFFRKLVRGGSKPLNV